MVRNFQKICRNFAIFLKSQKFDIFCEISFSTNFFEFLGPFLAPKIEKKFSKKTQKFFIFFAGDFFASTKKYEFFVSAGPPSYPPKGGGPRGVPRAGPGARAASGAALGAGLARTGLLALAKGGPEAGFLALFSGQKQP